MKRYYFVETHNLSCKKHGLVMGVRLLQGANTFCRDCFLEKFGGTFSVYKTETKMKKVG